MSADATRRSFLISAGAAAMALHETAGAQQPNTQGPEQTATDREAWRRWTPAQDRKVRVGIAGYGVCRWGAAFGFQNHPNVVVAAVSDLVPERRAALARACRCDKTYPSCEEMIKDDTLEAIFVATCAPSHAELSIMALKAGKHVAVAVPAVWGSLEEADELYEAVKSSGRKYMLFETSYYHNDLYAIRELFRGGHLGKVVYAEGEYYHFCPVPIDSFRGWRIGLPPQWYPTHSNAYYTGVTGLPFTEVSCMGFPSAVEHLKPENNRYRNAFGTEIALLRSADGAISRMAVSWDTPGDSGEKGRIRAQRGTYYGRFQTYGDPTGVPEPRKPPLPPGVEAGGHGGSHGYLMAEFIEAILMDRKPLVDVGQALTMTVAGIVAHTSARRGGELMKIPQYPF